MLLVTVWVVCSDGPHPFVCTEQAGCALVAATGLVRIFAVRGKEDVSLGYLS